jgi:hypothetical protein
LIIGNIPAIEWLTLSITSVRAADRLLRAGVRTTMSSPEPTANAPSVSTCPSSLPACSRSCQQTARASSELRHHLRCTSAARVVRHRSSRRLRRRCGSPKSFPATNSTTRRLAITWIASWLVASHVQQRASSCVLVGPSATPFLTPARATTTGWHRACASRGVGNSVQCEQIQAI